MALETLLELTEIDDFEVKRVVWDHPRENFIEINDKAGAITFKFQSGPIHEVGGVDGVQPSTLIKTAMIMIEGFNRKFPCKENAQALDCLLSAIQALEDRKKDREARGVEGFNQA